MDPEAFGFTAGTTTGIVGSATYIGDGRNRVVAVGNLVMIAHSKHIDRKVRGLTLNVRSVSEKTFTVYALDGATMLLNHTDVEALLPRHLGDEVRLPGNHSLSVQSIEEYTFNGSIPLKDILQITPGEELPARIEVGSIVLPLDGSKFTPLPREVLTHDQGKLTFAGLTGRYRAVDFYRVDIPIEDSIVLFDDKGEKQLLYGTRTLNEYLREKYKINFRDLTRLLNTEEVVSLSCSNRHGERAIELSKGSLISADNRVNDIVEYINKVITGAI